MNDSDYNMLLEQVTEQYLLVEAETKKLDENKKILFAEMERRNHTKVMGLYGGFQKTERKTYSFPAEITLMQDEVDKQKELAKLNGTAEAKVSVSYRYSALKI